MSDESGPFAHLVLIRSADGEKTFSISKDEFVLGRDRDADVHLDFFEVSRKHARIRIAGGSVYVRDLGSSNGTFIGGQRLRPNQEVMLTSEEIEVALGDVAWIKFKPATKPAAAIKTSMSRAEAPSAPVEWVPAPQSPGAGSGEESLIERYPQQDSKESAQSDLGIEIELDHPPSPPSDSGRKHQSVLQSAAPVNPTLKSPERSTFTVKTDSPALAMARIEAIQNEAIQSAEKIQSEATEHAKRTIEEAELEAASIRETARRFSEDAEQKALALRENARKECDEELRQIRGEIQELEFKKAELAESLELLNADSDRVGKTCEELETRVQKAELILVDLEKRREEMEEDATRAATEVNEAAEQKDLLDGEAKTIASKIVISEKNLRELEESIATKAQELRAVESAVKQEMQMLDTEKRRQLALIEAANAEYRAKKLNLEASIGEVEIKRVDARARLQEVLSQVREVELSIESKKSEFERGIAERTERLARTEHEIEQTIALIKEKQQEIESVDAELRSRAESVAQLNESETLAREKEREANTAMSKAESDFLAFQKKLEERFRELMAQQDQQLANDRQTATQQFERQLAERRQEAEHRFVAQAKEMERELAEAKLKELEKIKKLQAEAEEQERHRKRFILEEIVRAAAEIGKESPFDETKFRKTATSVLGGKSTGTLSAAADRRTREFWKHIAIYAAGPLACVMLFVTFPGIPHAIRGGLNRRIASEKQSEGGVFLDQIKMNGMRYTPPQDQTFRANYSDNILYLQSYEAMKLDENEKKNWTLLLNDFIVGKLGLSDRVIPDFVSAEAVMVHELVQLKDEILPQFKEQGLARMAAAEKQDVATLDTLLQTPDNYVQFREFEKSYYEDYMRRKGLLLPVSSPAPSRSPHP